jgi:hypothetical protein
MKYICIKECFYRSKLWKLGDHLNSKSLVPKHFEEVNKSKPELKTNTTKEETK